MFFRFLGPSDSKSWARDDRLKVAAPDEEALVSGIGGHIGQHTAILLAVTTSLLVGA